MPRIPTSNEFDYVLQAERDLPEEERTVWRMRCLTWGEYQRLQRSEWRPGRRGAEPTLVIDPMKKAREALTLGLVGWRNLRDTDGKEIPFSAVDQNGRRALPDPLLDLLAPWAVELANAVTERTDIGPETQKNS